LEGKARAINSVLPLILRTLVCFLLDKNRTKIIGDNSTDEEKILPNKVDSRFLILTVR